MFSQISGLFEWFSNDSTMFIKICTFPLVVLTTMKMLEEVWKQIKNTIKCFKNAKKLWGEMKVSQSKWACFKSKIRGWYDTI